MSTSIVIRAATIDDAQAILSLQYLCYESEARLYDDWSIPPLKQTLQALQAQFASMLFLKATLEQRVIGSVRAETAGDTCHIGRLIVHPDFQRRGLGKRLMREIEAAHAQMPRFELFTGSASVANIRLYESLGYRQFRSSELPGGVTLVHLEKTAHAAHR